MSELFIHGKYLAKLQEEISNADYCYVCGEHPSHGHGGNQDCPMRKLEERQRRVARGVAALAEHHEKHGGLQ